MPELIGEIHDNGRRVDLTVRSPIPGNVRANAAIKQVWAQRRSVTWSCDLRYTRTTGVVMYICGEPAREAIRTFISWVHGSLRAGLRGNTLCHRATQEENDELAAMVGIARTHAPNMIWPGRHYPPATACCHCEEDSTAYSKVSRCGGCKLTR
ncbi:hypothetical protein CPB84DRAFT_266446 [Gymnopilus junonius]|uniref:Uncharacterized protein n=1 Tax=Gymnopilus junonius TaxID=109634 RepID=A0A9P5NWD3_GYMJU|nr:hypothetical protein CPB84DRAFT_266446 [Gymnopilus junonius]